MNTKKSKKSQTKNNSYRGVDVPSVVDMDVLAYTSDDDLERRAAYLHAERDRASRFEYDLLPWETEICYVQRELKIRHDRRVAHEKYLLTLSSVHTDHDDFGDHTPAVLN